jgi:hypothetical protein
VLKDIGQYTIKLYDGHIPESSFRGWEIKTPYEQGNEWSAVFETPLIRDSTKSVKVAFRHRNQTDEKITWFDLDYASTRYLLQCFADMHDDQARSYCLCSIYYLIMGFWQGSYKERIDQHEKRKPAISTD